MIPAAHFTTVPHQSITEPIAVGVVAHHADGIERVIFAVADGHTKVQHPSINPQTGVYEYWTWIDPEFVSIGSKVDALVVPRQGNARHLTLPLYSALADTEAAKAEQENSE